MFGELGRYSDEEVENFVKNLLGMAEKGLIMESIYILKDLGTLIRESTIHYNQDFIWQDVGLTNEFKEAYEEYLSRNRWEIEYFDSTAVITTPTMKNIFVPNQWFVIASYAVGVYSELHRYKKYFEKVSSMCKQKTDVFAKKLRDDTINVDKTDFIENAKKLLLCECQKKENVEKSVKRLWRFVTDYSWWSGQKTIDRGDFYVSVILNMLNLVNASQGYVGDIVNAYGSDAHLKELTKSLDTFTTNMEGSTYDILLPATSSDITYMLQEEKNIYGKEELSHKIKISANSLKKIGGR